jgi:hypothetical protein
VFGVRIILSQVKNPVLDTVCVNEAVMDPARISLISWAKLLSIGEIVVEKGIGCVDAGVPNPPESIRARFVCRFWRPAVPFVKSAHSRVLRNEGLRLIDLTFNPIGEPELRILLTGVSTVRLTPGFEETLVRVPLRLKLPTPPTPKSVTRERVAVLVTSGFIIMVVVRES